MVKANKWRSRSAGPHVAPKVKQHKHKKIGDLMTEEDRKELQMNKYEESMTLAELQDRIKRQPDQYKIEFKTHFNRFVEKLKEFKLNPAKKDTDLCDYFKFMSHVSALTHPS